MHPEARREVLARLLKLNHRSAAEAEQVLKQVVAIEKAAKEKKARQVQPAEAAPRQHSKGIYFARGAIASYAVDRLGDR